MGTGRINAVGVGVDALDLETAASKVLEATKNNTNSYVCLTGAHGIVEARRNAPLAEALRNASLVLPDGMPIVWIGRSQGFGQVDRVFGPDLMLKVFDQTQASGDTHFFYGGNPGVAEELARRMQERFPKARIVGTYAPPFRKLNALEDAELAALLKKCRPDILWVGISTPKQELFMSEYSSHLQARVMIGVGAAFDFHTGRLNDSPRWVKRAGLQWLHRLLQEPGRLWRRYCRTNTIFLTLALLGVAGIKRFPPLVESRERRTNQASPAVESSLAD